MEQVISYTTSTCPECERAVTILESLGIPYVKWAIDLDPEAQTDALMLKIVKVPAVVAGGWAARKAVAADDENLEAAMDEAAGLPALKPPAAVPALPDDEVPDVPKEAVRLSIACAKCGGTFTSKKTLDRHARTCKGKQVTLDLGATA